MKSRSDKNSTTAAVAGFQGSMGNIPLPEGVTLRSDEEHVIWGQFTRARAREDWRDMDLLLLAKVVRMEADIRKHQNEIDVAGTLVEDKRGREVLNPIISVVDTLERRQMAVIRSMSLNQTASDPRTLNGAANADGSTSDVLRNLGASGLIALPANS
tara:strand:- start:403 stop:873 length:471 start_codon:yes stop_codon:yes gene_type:complete